MLPQGRSPQWGWGEQWMGVGQAVGEKELGGVSGQCIGLSEPALAVATLWASDSWCY